MTAIPRVKLKQDVLPGWSARREKEFFLTGCEQLNRLTGGIPRSAVVEITGQTSSGRTALVHSILGASLEAGRVCAYIDSTNAFDPVSAAQTDLPLERLLWVRCDGSLKKTLLAADSVLNAGGFSLIVLDLADISPKNLEKIPFSCWYRFQRKIEKLPSTLLIVSRLPLTKSCASLAICCQSPQPVWSGQNGNVLNEFKLDLLIHRPEPKRSSSVLLKSYFWSEQKNVRCNSFS